MDRATLAGMPGFLVFLVAYAGIGGQNSETIDGQIWANIWMTDFIVRIDPATGDVTSLVDLTGLKADAGATGTDSVLNGIAWDAKQKRLFVTGKYWPKLYQIALADCG